jgi:transposase
VNQLIRIGMDTSKSVFVLHGVDAAEQPVLRRKLRRRQVVEFFTKLPPTCIGIEACGAAHHWGRRLAALGNEVKLLPPQLVKPYVARNKNDAADAEAICEAMSRPRMRFVPVKSAEQQAALMLAGLCDQVTRRRTQLSNTIRGHAAEFGLVAAKGHAHIVPLLTRLAADPTLPRLARELFDLLGEQYAEVTREERALHGRLMGWHKHNELSRRLAEVPSLGPIGAALMVMKVPDPQQRLGVITRAGDETLRRLLVVGATAVIQQVQRGRGHPSPWLVELVKRKPPKLAAVALANKTARIAWKLMVSGERYRAKPRPGRVKSSSPRSGSVAPCSRRQGRCAPPSAVACGQP